MEFKRKIVTTHISSYHQIFIFCMVFSKSNFHILMAQYKNIDLRPSAQNVALLIKKLSFSIFLNVFLSLASFFSSFFPFPLPSLSLLCTSF